MEAIPEIIRLGLAFERARLEGAAHNLAIANVPQSSSSNAKKSVVNATNEFANKLGLDPSSTANAASVKTVHDPSHPMADANGNVYFVNVDPTHEMATLVSATRAYEANVRSFNTMVQMQSKALEIGGRR